MKLLVMAIAFYSSSIFAQDAEKGKELFGKCVACHGEKGEGNAEQKAPRIGGQHDWYIISSITAFKNGDRQNPVMMPFIKNLSEQDIANLAAYIQGL